MPQNVKVDGVWTALDTSLERTPDGWVDELHPLAPELPEAAGGDLLSVTNDGFTVSWRLLGAADVPGATTKSRADNGVLYPDILTGVDLKYEVERSYVKESMVLDAPPTSAPEYRWVLTAPGLTVEPDGLGGFDLIDAGGAIRFSIPTPTMWDSSGVKGAREPETAVVAASAEPLGDDWLVALRPDFAWLTAPDRVYPVTVDPSTSPGSSARRSYKSDGTSQSGYTWFGNPWQSNHALYWRGYSQYPFGNIAGSYLTDSAIGMSYSTGTTNCYTGYIGSGSTNPTSVSSYGSDVSSFAMCGGGASASSGTIDGLDSQLASWIRGGCYSCWVGFRSSAEANSAYSYKGADTYVALVYASYPATPGITGSSPKNGQIAPVAPTMQGTSSTNSGTALTYRYEFEKTGGSGTGSGPFTAIAYDTGWVASGPFQLPASALEPGTQYRYRVTVRDGYDGWLGNNTKRTATNAAWYFTTNGVPVVAQTGSIPSDGEVVTTTEPQFSVGYAADPDDSDPVTYKFVVTTGDDGRNGAVVTSGWITPPSTTPGDPVTWTPVAGSLQDGIRYTWRVWADDGFEQWEEPWIGHFTVNRRLGTSGPSPFDSAGPATVNLANGNLALNFGSPMVAALGGAMGMSFSYNSQADPNANAGLVGAYYNALNPGQTSTSTFDFTGRTPVLTRTDTVVTFVQPGQIAPAVPADYWMARWTGFVRVPTAGSYTFGALHDDGVKVVVDTTTVLDKWTGSAPSIEWGTAKTLSGGVATPIRIDYFDSTGAATLDLRVKGPGITDPDGIPVPADWFTKTVQYLPGGWTNSGPVNGAGGFYVLATKTSTTVTLTDVTGSVHTYAKRSDGGYTAPNGEYGVLSLDTTGQVTLSDGGTVYQFDAAGHVSSVTTPQDAKKPATPTIQYRANGTPDLIADPIAGGTSRKVQFVYGGDLVSNSALGLSGSDSDGTGTACPIPAGTNYAAPPADFLCRIVYPGHVAGTTDTTRLFYNAQGQLVSIVDPGGEQTIFSYSSGRLNRVWDPLVNDWIGDDPANRSPVPLVATEISYDGAGRVDTVTLPAPDGASSALRPEKTYTYAAGATFVDVAGLDLSGAPSGAHAGTVTYDSGWRATSSTTPLGLTSTQTWSAKDQVLSSTNAQGVMSTTIYDPFTDLPTDSYGPAPASCFGVDLLPTSGCPVTVAHSSTGYDSGMSGLQVSYFGTNNLSGRPVDFSLGLVGGTGSLGSRNWSTGSPTSSVPADNFSLRMNGIVTFPTAGTYQFRTTFDGGGSVYLNDDRIINDSVYDSTASTVVSQEFTGVAAGERRRIRVDLRHDRRGAPDSPVEGQRGRVDERTRHRPDTRLRLRDLRNGG